MAAEPHVHASFNFRHSPGVAIESYTDEAGNPVLRIGSLSLILAYTQVDQVVAAATELRKAKRVARANPMGNFRETYNHATGKHEMARINDDGNPELKDAPGGR